jgi:hypothetical protein
MIGRVLRALAQSRSRCAAHVRFQASAFGQSGHYANMQLILIAPEPILERLTKETFVNAYRLAANRTER